MKKSIKKVLSVILAMTILFTIPVIAFAADDTFDFDSVSIRALTGTWKKDTVDRVQITITGAGRKLLTNDVILTVGTNDAANNICTVTLADATVEFTGKKTIIEFDLNKKLDHSKVYNFLIKEGVFGTTRNAENNAYKLSVTGNVLVETLDVTPYDVPNNPIYRWINYMEESKYRTLLYPVIVIFRFFAGL